jgi:hypothetical protein
VTCDLRFCRWGRAVALSVYTGELAAKDEQQQQQLLEM